MLNGIKSMIQEKTNFLEAAEIIFEDGSGMNLDDQIILGESDNLPIEDPDIALGEDGTDDDQNEPEVPESGDNEPDNKDENNQGEGNNKDEVPSNNTDVSNDNDTPIEDMEIDNDEPQDTFNNEPSNNSDDLLDSNIEDEPIEGDVSENDSVNGGLPGEDLPEPIGAQTGEPINPDDDILNVEVDLGSNTVKDVLPVPPAGASDMVPTEDGETPTQHVDSGFGNINESGKDDNIKSSLTIYGVNFKIPDKIDGFIDSYNKSKLTDDISTTARTAMISMITPSNIKKIEKSILDAEKEIGEKDDTDDIRIERIKKYLSKADVGKFLCTNSGKVSMIKINMKHIDGVLNAWEEHEMWITSKGEVITYDDVNVYKESYNESSFVESYFSSIGLGNTSFQEAITLADDVGGDEGNSDSKPNEDTGSDDTSIDTSGLEDTPMDEPAAEESPVTSAVKDKVAESDEENDISVDGGSEAKLEILKKLGNITKNIEDAKKAVMNSIQ